MAKQELQLSDLHNPDGITAILTTREGLVELGPNQGFQCLPKRTELWQKLDNGQLLKVKGWTRSIIAYYK